MEGLELLGGEEGYTGPAGRAMSPPARWGDLLPLTEHRPSERPRTAPQAHPRLAIASARGVGMGPRSPGAGVQGTAAQEARAAAGGDPFAPIAPYLLGGHTTTASTTTITTAAPAEDSELKGHADALLRGVIELDEAVDVVSGPSGSDSSADEGDNDRVFLGPSHKQQRAPHAQQPAHSRSTVHRAKEPRQQQRHDRRRRARTAVGRRVSRVRRRLLSAGGSPRRRRGLSARWRKQDEALDELQQQLHFDIFHLSEHRPFFLSWAVFVQVVVAVAMLLTYSVETIALAHSTETGATLSPDGFPRSQERNSSVNLYIGPAFAELVLLGAKFGPCMRPDGRVVSATIDPARVTAQNQGCCSRQAGGVCFNAEAAECPATQDFNPNATCLASPLCCQVPAEFPDCMLRDPNLLPVDPSFDVCRCSSVAARPCCLGVYGGCVIATQEECAFRKGAFQPDALSCSEVDCLEATCGLSPFASRFIPDQWYRMFTAVFLHSGLLQLIIVLICQFYLGFDVERIIGWWRMGLLYTVSGSGGYLLSAIVTPYQVGCGATPALMSLLGVLGVELALNWRALESPWGELRRVVFLIFCAFGIGLFPYFDNVAHAGGLCLGVLGALAVMPWEALSAWHRARKRVVALLAALAIVAAFVVMFVVLYRTEATCEFCESANCHDFADGLCASHGQTFLTTRL